mmetsp:Transcript_62967/g.180525  ORF Transcript_62967/g.180525 Transcript_62967/m.180525 type:complete len:210 (-) Transcript_62967:195-824(-)
MNVDVEKVILSESNSTFKVRLALAAIARTIFGTSKASNISSKPSVSKLSQVPTKLLPSLADLSPPAFSPSPGPASSTSSPFPSPPPRFKPLLLPPVEPRVPGNVFSKAAVSWLTFSCKSCMDLLSGLPSQIDVMAALSGSTFLTAGVRKGKPLGASRSHSGSSPRCSQIVSKRAAPAYLVSLSAHVRSTATQCSGSRTITEPVDPSTAP